MKTVFALTGNPNSGKTTLFNCLTGSNGHVGNFPGVTVEKKEGTLKNHKNTVITDLPGIYSLSPYSAEEIVTRNFIINEKPDCIINIADATALERSLFLTLQLAELGVPMVLALSMMDEATSSGIEVNTKRLSHLLGMPVIAISANKNKGIDNLTKLAFSAIKNTTKYACSGFYDGNAAARYKFIEKICSECVTKNHDQSKSQLLSRKIDSILTHKIFAMPIFFCIMFSIFWTTFGPIGGAFKEIFASGIDYITRLTDKLLISSNASPWIHSLIIDGVFAGVGSVLSFLPTILLLFFLLSILEDSGYMARVAFIMDRPLRRIGLSGHSFVPMLIGFGCSVPAIMATRTLSSSRDRWLTILLVPFMSCSAKLPIYAIFTAAFFPNYGALVMTALYFFGIFMGILSTLILKHTVFGNKSIPFMLELPSYRFPGIKNVCRNMYEKAGDFFVKAFVIIFPATIIIWLMQSYDMHFNLVADNSQSILATLGNALSPLFLPLGFGNRHAVTALITGLTAKEAVLSTLSVLTGTNAASLTYALTEIFTPLQAFSFLIFTLLYTPCIASIAAIKREFCSFGKATLVMLYQTAFAWTAAFIVYSFGLLFIS